MIVLLRCRCWGDNEEGQLGNGAVSSYFQPPVAVSSLRNVLSITAGDFHTCAVEGDSTGARTGKVACWGDNRLGQLGYVRIPGLSTGEGGGARLCHCMKPC